MPTKSNYPIHMKTLLRAVEFALQQEEVFKEIAGKERRKEVPFYKEIGRAHV